jgi:deazaflavin-dependent oxidoreductase (nitroreductase family)
MVAEGPGGSEPGDKNHPAFRMTRGRRIGDAIIGAFIRVGVVPNSYMLTTRGRKTGQLRTNPVTLVEHDGRRWLVAPYGPVSWVLNARAAGRVTIRRRGQRLDCTVREVSREEAGPILKEYLKMARPTRRYFHATPDARVEEFIAEAGRHPVFELTVESHGR